MDADSQSRDLRLTTSTLRVISAGDPGAPPAAIPPLARKVRVARPATGTLTGQGRSCSPCNRDLGGAGSSCNPCNRHPDRRGKVLQPLQPVHPPVIEALAAVEPLPWPRQLGEPRSQASNRDMAVSPSGRPFMGRAARRRPARRVAQGKDRQPSSPRPRRAHCVSGAWRCGQASSQSSSVFATVPYPRRSKCLQSSSEGFT
jgi:hypothetical protein